MPENGFTRSRILTALTELGNELTNRGVRGQIFVVGGAAMALAYSTRTVTKDIDAVFEPKTVIYEAARHVAERLELPDDWLNDAVKGYLPGDDHDAKPVPEIEGIEVTTASPRYLLAMKLLAMRFGEDDEDIHRPTDHHFRGIQRIGQLAIGAVQRTCDERGHEQHHVG